jgi:hypothetical protein
MLPSGVPTYSRNLCITVTIPACSMLHIMAAQRPVQEVSQVYKNVNTLFFIAFVG